MTWVETVVSEAVALPLLLPPAAGATRPAEHEELAAEVVVMLFEDV